MRRFRIVSSGYRAQKLGAFSKGEECFNRKGGYESAE